MRKKAFTLIELLVVIAIIALLMAILMPALARVKKQAKAVACQAQLKQWGLIWSMYTQDNNGYFHRGWCSLPTYAERMDGLWMSALWPYYKQEKDIIFCPMAKNPRLTVSLKYGTWGPAPKGNVLINEADVYGSYGLNCWVASPSEEGTLEPLHMFWKTSAVRSAGRIPVFGDACWERVFPRHQDIPPEYENQFDEGTTGFQRTLRIFCINRHNGAINLLFMDWSVRRVGLKALWDLPWHHGWNANGDPPPAWPAWMNKFSN